MANCGPDYRYRVYMSGVLVIAERLKRLASVADFVIIVTLKAGLTELPASDLDLLASRGVKVRYGRSIWDRFFERDRAVIPNPERAAEKSVMYNKLFAWEMTEYDAIQYLDADCMPSGGGGGGGNTMDRYFTQLPRTTFIRGWMSPLQGGWYLLKPSKQTFDDLIELVRHRYSSEWDPVRSFDLHSERPIKDNQRPCLDDDQGLFWCYFRYSRRAPPMDYVDHKNTRVSSVQTVERGQVVHRYPGKNFTFRWEHFGGRFKPWRVCSDPQLVRSLPSIASKHASHWPSSKLGNFKLYCEVFRDLQLGPFVKDYMKKPNPKPKPKRI